MSGHAQAQVQTQQQTVEQESASNNQNFGSNSDMNQAVQQASSGSFAAMVAAEGNKLTVGMKNSAAVEWLQNFLLQKGYAISAVDGWFGNNTASCVKKFQKDKGLHVDGWVGPKTAAFIDTLGGVAAPVQGNQQGNGSGASAQPAPVASSPSASNLVAPQPWLQRGSTGAGVVALQNALKHLNFDPGPADGVFGGVTTSALQKFQKANGLTQDGKYGPKTQAKLQEVLNGSSSSVGNAVEAPAQQNNAPVENVPASISTALSWTQTQVGAPYYGGASPFRDGHAPGNGQWYQMQGQNRYLSQLGVIGYDCSGFVNAYLKKAGLSVKYYSSTGMLGYQSVPKTQMQPGDLFVKSGHVAIYLGNGQSIESKPAGVTIDNASKFISNSAYTGHRPS